MKLLHDNLWTLKQRFPRVGKHMITLLLSRFQTLRLPKILQYPFDIFPFLIKSTKPDLTFSLFTVILSRFVVIFLQRVVFRMVGSCWKIPSFSSLTIPWLVLNPSYWENKLLSWGKGQESDQCSINWPLNHFLGWFHRLFVDLHVNSLLGNVASEYHLLGVEE